MLTLIKKDLMAFSHIILFQLIIVLTIMSFGIFYDHNGTLTVLILIIYPISLPTILLINDAKFERLLISLPTSRVKYVLGKYIVGLLCAYGIIMIGLIYSYLINHYITESIAFYQLYSYLGLMLLGIPTLLTVSITFPIYFKFTKSKASGVLIVVFSTLLIAGILGLVYFEKTQSTDIYYQKSDIFPVLAYQLTEFIKKIGIDSFLKGLTLSILSIFLSSITLSLLLTKRKDIGGLL